MTTLPQTSPWGDDTPTGVRLKAATGTNDPGLQEVLVRQVQDTMPASPWGNATSDASLSEAAVVALREMGPQDTVEGMLAGQFVAVHCSIMDCFRRAASAGASPEVRDMNLRHGEKLMAAGLRLHEALERRQGKGPANVTVGLNVEPGGQAVVGVQVGRGGGQSAGRPRPEEACGEGPGSTSAGEDARIKWFPAEDGASQQGGHYV
jgi:hypothetical protein